MQRTPRYRENSKLLYSTDKKKLLVHNFVGKLFDSVVKQVCHYECGSIIREAKLLVDKQTNLRGKNREAQKGYL